MPTEKLYVLDSYHDHLTTIKENLEKQGAPVMAICYDFDKTLSPKDMQEYGFIPQLGLSVEEFWKRANNLVENCDADDILAYMLTMVKESSRMGKTLTRDDLHKLGNGIVLFNGVKEWFNRITLIGLEAGIVIEHYIISSGLKEIIESTSIAQYIKDIFASEFLYDEKGQAIWASQAVNFTNKTQYLYRINKDVDIESVNLYMPDEKRRVPFSNIIYIGDSDTDIPCMRLVQRGGGNSIGVYNPDNEKGLAKVQRLLLESRINYYAPADYSENSPLYNIVKNIISGIKVTNDLQSITAKQIIEAKKNFLK